MKKGWKVFLIILTLIILVLAVYFTFFFSYTCKDASCYYSHQVKCVETKFTKSDSTADWSYQILGKSGSDCKIKVTLTQVKLGDIENLNLEKKSMVCSLPKGSQDQPDTDLSKCTGPLKEELQSLIIGKLHAYILSNLGEIKGNLTAPL